MMTGRHIDDLTNLGQAVRPAPGQNRKRITVGRIALVACKLIIFSSACCIWFIGLGVLFRITWNLFRIGWSFHF